MQELFLSRTQDLDNRKHLLDFSHGYGFPCIIFVLRVFCCAGIIIIIIIIIVIIIIIIIIIFLVWRRGTNFPIPRPRPQASVCYISRVLPKDPSVLSQCNTRLRLLHFIFYARKTIKHAFSMFHTLIKHGFSTNQSTRWVLYFN